MEIEIKLDPTYKNPKITIQTESVTKEVNEVIQRINQTQNEVLTGFSNGEARLLDKMEIYRFYASEQKVYAVTKEEEYMIRFRLYELEKRLDSRLFVRISNSEIVNLKQIEKFDLSFAGTICVILKNKEKAFVSRRYVSKIKKILGL